MKVNVPRNIKKYEPKLIGGFTARNLIFMVLGFAVAGLWFLLLHSILPWSILFIFCIVLSLPVFLMGFLKVSGIYFGEVLKIIIKTELLGTETRLYKTRGYNDEEKK